MANKSFLDTLAEINAQNYLGGLVNAGEAIKEQKQNEALNQMYADFRGKQNELTSTDDQLGQFAKQAESLLAEGGTIPPEINAQMNMLKVIGQMDSYQKTYQPYITAFAALGTEEGVRLANALTNELGAKMGILETTSELPFKALQLAKMQEDFEWTKDQHIEWSNELSRNKDLAEVTDYIISNPMFEDIEAGNIKAWTPERLAAFTAKQKAVIQNTFEKFGGKVSEGAISKAFKMAMDLTGRSFTFDESGILEAQRLGMEQSRINLMMKQYQDKMGLSSLDVQSYLSNLRGWSQQWTGMNQDLRNAVKKYIATGQLPSAEDSKIGAGISPDRVKELAQIFSPTPIDANKPNYMVYYSILSQAMPGFTSLQKVKLGSGETFTPLIQGTEDIIRPQGMTGFQTGNFNYNPYTWQKLNKLNQDAINNMLNESNFPVKGENKEDEPLLNQLYNLRPGSSAIPMNFGGQ